MIKKKWRKWKLKMKKHKAKKDWIDMVVENKNDYFLGESVLLERFKEKYGRYPTKEEEKGSTIICVSDQKHR